MGEQHVREDTIILGYNRNYSQQEEEITSVYMASEELQLDFNAVFPRSILVMG